MKSRHPPGYMREYDAKNPDATRSRHYKKRYGVTLEQLEEMLVAQNSQCAICTKTIQLRGVKGRDMAVLDHCHVTKKNRGLLCTPCNLMIGYSKDNPDTLRAAIEYLENTN